MPEFSNYVETLDPATTTTGTILIPASHDGDAESFTPAQILAAAGGGGGGAVDSVNGETGVVVLSAADVGADPAGTAAGLVATEVTNRNAAIAAASVGLWDDRGNFNPSGGAYPTSANGGSGTAGAILKGDTWTYSAGGTQPTGLTVEAGDTVRALIDTPGNTQANWAILQNNIGFVPANVANPLSQFAATTSAQLAGVISDETGSGALVFATSPTLVTPALGTPSAIVLTNATGLPGTAVINTPAGNIAAINVQAAINELDTEKQPIDSDLTAIAALTPSNDDILQRKSGAWTNRTLAQIRTDLALVPLSREESLVIPFSDMVTPITATTNKKSIPWPYVSTTITRIKGNLVTAQTSGSIFTIDVNKNGTTMLSTKITIDNTERTSATAATAPVLSVTSITEDDDLSIDVDQQGDNTAKGGSITVYYTRA